MQTARPQRRPVGRAASTAGPGIHQRLWSFAFGASQRPAWMEKPSAPLTKVLVTTLISGQQFGISQQTPMLPANLIRKTYHNQTHPCILDVRTEFSP